MDKHCGDLISLDILSSVVQVKVRYRGMIAYEHFPEASLTCMTGRITLPQQSHDSD